MKNFSKIIVCIFLLSFSGCGLFDSDKNRVIGNYIVMWIDEPQNQSLDEEVKKYSASSNELIPAYVFATGHNDHYIIAKQHPTNGFEGGYKINPAVTNYYVIDMKKEVIIPAEKVIGPLTEFQFDSLITSLHISEIKFDKVFPDTL